MKNKKINEKRLLELLKDGIYQTKIAKLTGISKSRISRKITQLLKSGLIQKTNTYPPQYILTGEGRRTLYILKKDTVATLSGGMPHDGFIKDSVNLHSTQLNIPIINFGTIPKGYEFVKLNNWVKYTKKFEIPVPLTIEINTKLVQITLREKDLPHDTFPVQQSIWLTKGIFFTYYELKKYNFELDLTGIEIANQHYENELAKELDDTMEKNSVVHINLDRQAKGVFPCNFEAKAWIDASKRDKPVRVSAIETNDMCYQEKLIKLPERAEVIMNDMKEVRAQTEQYNKNLALYNEQIEKHLQAVNGICENMAKMNVMLDKLSSAIEELKK